MSYDKAFYDRHKLEINRRAREARAAAAALRPSKPPVPDEVLELRRQRDAERKRAWAAKNAEALLLKRQEKYLRDRDGAIKAAVEWNRENKARRAEICAKYAANNPEQRRATKAARRARSRAALGRFSKADVARLLVLQKGQCAACRSALDEAYEVDHVVPLAKGGTNEASNLQLLCRTCNRSKGAKHPVDFMRERGFLL